jgi:hypothetical protein
MEEGAVAPHGGTPRWVTTPPIGERFAADPRANRRRGPLSRFVSPLVRRTLSRPRYLRRSSESSRNFASLRYLPRIESAVCCQFAAIRTSCRRTRSHGGENLVDISRAYSLARDRVGGSGYPSMLGPCPQNAYRPQHYHKRSNVEATFSAIKRKPRRRADRSPRRPSS